MGGSAYHKASTSTGQHKQRTYVYTHALSGIRTQDYQCSSGRREGAYAPSPRLKICAGHAARMAVDLISVQNINGKPERRDLLGHVDVGERMTLIRILM
jgi:hypothetical protein